MTGWPIFSALAGFLLPFALAIRIATTLARDTTRRWGDPIVMFRLIKLSLIAIPLVANLPGAVWLLTGYADVTGPICLAYAGTGWGAARLALIIVATLLIDLAKPMLDDQLTRAPVSTVWPTRTYLMRDAGVLLILLGLAALASGFIR